MTIQFMHDKTTIEFTPRIALLRIVRSNYVLRHMMIGWLTFRIIIEFNRKRDFCKE